VRGHLRVRPIDTRLVAASFGDARLQIVGDDDLGHAPQKLEGAHVGADPVGQTLRASRLGVTVVAGSQYRDEDLRRRRVAARTRVDGNGTPGLVDKYLPPRPMLVSQTDFLSPKPSFV